MVEIDKKTLDELLEKNKEEKKTYNKLESFSDGILVDSFNTPKGSPREIYTELLKKLMNIYTFLLHDRGKCTTEKQDIITSIEEFLGKRTLPSIHLETQDFSQKGRIITLSRDDDKKTSKCAEGDAEDQRKSYREDQYFILNNNLCLLIAKATSFIPDDKFSWSTEKIMVDVEPENQYNQQE